MVWISKLRSKIGIKVANGRAQLIKGKVSRTALSDISDICLDRGIGSGYVWVDPLGRVTCSGRGLKQVQQRLKNILSSQI